MTIVELKFASDNKISKEFQKYCNVEIAFELAKKLNKEDHNALFYGLKDWNLRMAYATNKYKLTSNNIHRIKSGTI